jgi:hypothetical protein
MTREDRQKLMKPTSFSGQWNTISLLLDRILPILDALEPHHPRRPFLQSNKSEGMFRMPKSYLQDIVRWKYVLLYLVPDLRRHIDFLGQHLRNDFQYVLASIDAPYETPDKPKLVIMLSWYYKDVCALRFVDTVNQSAREHLQCALEHRLIHLYSTLLTKRSINRKSHRQEGPFRAQVIPFCALLGVTQFLPPQLQDPQIQGRWDLCDTHNDMQCRLPEGAPDAQEVSIEKRTACVCSWVINSLPTGYLTTFGLCAEVLCLRIHKRKCSLAAVYYEVANHPDAARGLTKLYCHSIAYLLQIYFNHLVTETTSSSRVSGTLSHDRHDGLILSHSSGYVALDIFFIAMDLVSHFIKDIEQSREPMSGNAVSSLDIWCRSEGRGEEYEAVLREIICKAQLEISQSETGN